MEPGISEVPRHSDQPAGTEVPVLSISSVSKRFGGNQVLKDVSFSVGSGEVVGLLGPNGAGKSTLLQIIGGQLDPDEGEICLRGESIKSMGMTARVQSGICKTNQLARRFGSLTVYENVRTARKVFAGTRQPKQMREEIEGLLAELTLIDKGKWKSSTISVGQQKLLDLARVIARSPILLLADEPTAGVNPTLIPAVSAFLRRVGERGGAVLYVSHDLEALRAECSRLVALHTGRVVATGGVDEVLGSRSVIESYLGGKYEGR